jgi:hypothetical protein
MNPRRKLFNCQRKPWGRTSNFVSCASIIDSLRGPMKRPLGARIWRNRRTPANATTFSSSSSPHHDGLLEHGHRPLMVRAIAKSGTLTRQSNNGMTQRTSFWQE